MNPLGAFALKTDKIGGKLMKKYHSSCVIPIPCLYHITFLLSYFNWILCFKVTLLQFSQRLKPTPTFNFIWRHAGNSLVLRGREGSLIMMHWGNSMKQTRMKTVKEIQFISLCLFAWDRVIFESHRNTCRVRAGRRWFIKHKVRPWKTMCM